MHWFPFSPFHTFRPKQKFTNALSPQWTGSMEGVGGAGNYASQRMSFCLFFCVTRGTGGSDKRLVKTGSTIEETFPGQANKTSSTFFPFSSKHSPKMWRDRNTPAALVAATRRREVTRSTAKQIQAVWGRLRVTALCRGTMHSGYSTSTVCREP